MIQLSPPPVADTDQFEEIESMLRKVLTEASECLEARQEPARKKVGAIR